METPMNRKQFIYAAVKSGYGWSKKQAETYADAKGGNEFFVSDIETNRHDNTVGHNPLCRRLDVINGFSTKYSRKPRD